MTDAGVFCIIIHKFNYWEQLCTIIIIIIDKSSKINLYDTFLFFNLAIGLRVENSLEFLFDIKKIALR